jgi:hypothetical protein
MAWRMTSERWKELLEAGPSFVRGDPERVMAHVHYPTLISVEVRSALRRLQSERRDDVRHYANT